MHPYFYTVPVLLTASEDFWEHKAVFYDSMHAGNSVCVILEEKLYLF